MAILIGLWHRLILWVCLSPFLLRGWQGQTMDWVPIHSTEETYVRVCARD